MDKNTTAYLGGVIKKLMYYDYIGYNSEYYFLFRKKAKIPLWPMKDTDGEEYISYVDHKDKTAIFWEGQKWRRRIFT